jgi:hypothetical protein
MKTLPHLLVLLCLLSSFGGDTRVFTNTKLWLPGDFDSRNTILLVKGYSTGLSGDAGLKNAEDKITDDMKAEMQKLYPYKYEFVSGTQVSSDPKYANTDVYRYVIMESNGSTPVVISNNMPASQGPDPRHPERDRTGDKNFGLSVHDFHIYDRKLDKSYSPTGHPSNTVLPVFTTMINTIAEYLKGLTTPPAPLLSGDAH